MGAIRTLVVGAFCGLAAVAGPITFTETQSGIGTFNGTPFNNALVTIVLTGDTSGVTNPVPGVLNLPGTMTITVAGIGSGTLTDAGVVFVNMSGAVGMEDLTIPADILDTHNAGFLGYGLTTSIGPFSSGPGGNPADTFPTTFGDFVLSSSGNPDHQATFSAVTGTPEPGTLALLGAGIAGIGLLRRRGKAS